MGFAVMREISSRCSVVELGDLKHGQIVDDWKLMTPNLKTIGLLTGICYL